jgi:NAD(P)-dependent dehydrogenase (short-subunit alcohol dehydrogenase family)
VEKDRREASYTQFNQLLNLNGKVALVTGASARIGAGIARRLAEAGAAIAVHYRSGKDEAEALVAEIGKRGGTAIALHAELTDPAACDRLFAEASERLGAIDILVNNAARQTHADITEMDNEEWRGMLAANLDSAFFLTRAAGNAMATSGTGGAIVNIASISGLVTAHTHAHYATTKAALIMFTRATALEFGPSAIRVNSVSPGLIYNKGIEVGWPEGVERWMNVVPLCRMGTDQDIADAVLFLASPASRFITGTNLVVDGGVTASPAY